MPTRRLAFAVLTLTLCSCSHAPAAAPASAAPLSRGPVTRLRDPSADHRVGHLFTIENLAALASATVVSCSPNGASSPLDAPCGGPRLWARATPLPPEDGTVDAWQYSPWFDETLRVDGTIWRVSVFLGGLGILTDASGRRGAFLVRLSDAAATHG